MCCGVVWVLCLRIDSGIDCTVSYYNDVFELEAICAVCLL